MPTPVSATVITLDEADRLADCLASLAFCDEIAAGTRVLAPAWRFWQKTVRLWLLQRGVTSVRDPSSRSGGEA